MKKLVSAIFILALVLFVAPSQTYAAWWNPISWFSSENQIEEQNQSQNATSSDAVSKIQTVNQGVGAVEKQTVISPVKNSKSSDAKTIEDLKAEVATLKTNLDSLYKAHNELLKYTTETVTVIRSEIKNTPQAVVGNNLESLKIAALEEELRNYKSYMVKDLQARFSYTNPKIDELERTVDDICGWIFSGLSISCPSVRLGSGRNLEDRIEKLERAY